MYPAPTPTTLGADGEDPCIIDVTDAAIDGVTVLICLCGLVGNGVILRILGFHIRRNPITIYILNLAVSDIIFLLFAVTSSFLYMIEDVFCSTVGFLKHVRWLFLLSAFFYLVDLYILTAIRIERCVSFLRPSSSRGRPPWLTAVVCVLSWVVSITVTAVVTSLCMLHEYEQCKTAFITTFALSFLIFVPPMVIANVILFIKILRDSQQHQPRMLRMIIFFTDLFVLICTLSFRILFLLQEFVNLLLSFKVAFLILSIANSFCPFLYFLVGSCQRPCSFVSPLVTLQRVLTELEDNAAQRKQVTMDMPERLRQSISNNQINSPGTVAEGFPE